MKATIRSGIRALLPGVAVGVVLVSGQAALATSHGADDSVADRVRALEEKVARLEEQVVRLRRFAPSFAAFMPQFSERFHVLHRAGEVGDWQVARHELLEMQRLVDVSKVVDPKRGQMFQGFMQGPLSEINAAIEHEDGQRFLEALEGAIENCNACHQAAGSGFVRVSLDAPSVLSMRHAHELRESSVEDMEDTHEH